MTHTRRFRFSSLFALLLLAGGHAAPAQTPDPSAATMPPADRSHEIARIRGERGLSVCRASADGLRKYQGITQDYEQGKVKILVHVLDAATGQAVPGVLDTNVWDDPANWSICLP
ncbi:MAG: hypothetical protein QM661_07720 [Solimonas sp.]